MMNYFSHSFGVQVLFHCNTFPFDPRSHGHKPMAFCRRHVNTNAVTYLSCCLHTKMGDVSFTLTAGGWAKVYQNGGLSLLLAPGKVLGAMQ